MYFVGRKIWNCASDDNNDVVVFGRERKECILRMDLDAFMDTQKFKTMKFLFCPNKAGGTVKPLMLRGNFQEVIRLVGYIDEEVLGLTKFDVYYRDSGNLKIPHTPRVRDSFLEEVEDLWKEFLTNEKWVYFVKELGVMVEIAFRGESKEFLDTVYSDDMEVIQMAQPRYKTRAVARKEQEFRKKGNKKKIGGGKKNAMKPKKKSHKITRRSEWSWDDEDDDALRMRRKPKGRERELRRATWSSEDEEDEEMVSRKRTAKKAQRYRMVSSDEDEDDEMGMHDTPQVRKGKRRLDEGKAVGRKKTRVS